jgi:hypothetical protein
MRHSNHLQWKLIWQNQDTEPCQKIFPSLPRSTKCKFLSIYVESTKEMDLSASCLSSWQIKHFDQSVLCFSWADKESRILFDIHVVTKWSYDDATQHKTPSVCTELARSKTFGKIKCRRCCGTRAKVWWGMSNIFTKLVTHVVETQRGNTGWRIFLCGQFHLL